MTEAIRSIAVFVISAGGFFWLLVTEWFVAHLANPFTSGIASATAWMFRVAGQEAYALGASLQVNGTPVTIATGCNGLEAAALYLAATFAHPARFTAQIAGIAIGLIGIALVNQLRVVGLVLVAMKRPDFLFEAHNYIGQTFVIVMGTVLWVFWAEWYAVQRASRSGANPA